MLLLLREDQVAVQHDLELAAAALDQGGVDAALFLELGRQTGGPWKIVSSDAVGDLDLRHGALQYEWWPKVARRDIGLPRVSENRRITSLRSARQSADNP